MDIHFTARKFRARTSTREHATAAVRKLDKFYDGIVRGDIILSYERTTASVKVAEINLHVHGTMLSAKEKSEDFLKSVDLAVEKLERQLDKYKTKVTERDKRALRRVKEDLVPPPVAEEEE